MTNKYYPKRLVRIVSDVMEYWQDEETFSYMVDNDDMLEIYDAQQYDTVLYRIQLPGIYEWHMSYENATDFAETTTDPTFDYDKYNKRGLSYARLLRNLLPDDFVVEYQYAYEDKKHNCECITIPHSSAEQLMIDASRLLAANNVSDKRPYIDALKRFIDLCPSPMILNFYTGIDWDKEDIDIYWWSSKLDCRASIGKDEFTYHIWHGNNHGRKDDECFSNGIGGMDYECEDFAYQFYDSMHWIFMHDKEIYNCHP